MLYLNEKWKDLQLKCEIDEGTITGWDTWWRVGATSESDWNLLNCNSCQSSR